MYCSQILVCALWLSQIPTPGQTNVLGSSSTPHGIQSVVQFKTRDKFTTIDWMTFHAMSCQNEYNGVSQLNKNNWWTYISNLHDLGVSSMASAIIRLDHVLFGFAGNDEVIFVFTLIAKYIQNNNNYRFLSLPGHIICINEEDKPSTFYKIDIIILIFW